MTGSALITGGAGFIGSHVAERLVAAGWKVVAFDDLSVGRDGNVAHLREHQAFSFVRGDIADRSLLDLIVRDHNVDTIFHLAAIHYIPFCAAHPDQALRTNVQGTQAVIDAALAGATRKIVFASTGDVYAAKDSALSERDLVAPFTLYGLSKVFAEQLLRLAARAEPKLSVAVARLFNTYGPRETNPHVLPDVLKQLAGGGTSVRLGNTWPRRDFVFVEDVADALIALLGSGADFDVFNVGSGSAISIDDAVRVIGATIERPIAVVVDPERTRPVERACLHADITKIHNQLDWRPRYSFADGIRRWLEVERLPDAVTALPPRG